MPQSTRGFTLIEMMAVVAVVAILAAIAIPSMQGRIVRQQIEAAMPLADIAKKPVAAQWATAQQFPADNAATGLPSADKIVSNYVSAVTVKDGAIHVKFGNRANGAILGKTLTLRPAVVADAPIVPVTWVCGKADAPDKMTLQGSDETSIADEYLPMDCRKLKR
ncbi:pilin [Uliginosibacterium flavum]|uniref:Pilin n=1 Tax=Uliginosibacterium flavum TaxID=1396831 RepID=A0ABV2TM52_9RHOO